MRARRVKSENRYLDRSSIALGYRGASLPTVIMVVALMLMLGFTVVAIGFSHLNLTFRSSNNAKAQELAEAVLSVAIERARVDIENFGIKAGQENKTIKLSLKDLPEGNLGVLSFDPDTAKSLGVPTSFNNPSDASGSAPSQSIRIVAKGEVGGSTSIMEAIVEFPKFPFSIASKGAIKSNGGLLVAAVRQGADYSLGGPIDKGKLEPGSIVSNSTDSSSAIDLDGENTILGDVQTAAQTAKIGLDTKVWGEVRTNADQVKLPELSASDYDPLGISSKQKASDPDEVKMINSTSAGTLPIKGYNVFGTKLSDGSYNQNETLTVDNGIKLDGGVLFVNGNLAVNAGGIKGKGAIIATGNISVAGSGEAFTDNEAALVADGNITLNGDSDGNRAKFNGLIYTKGQMSASNMRLAGVFVAAGDSSAVQLKNTELYQVNDKAKIEIRPDPLDINWNWSPVGSVDGVDTAIPVTYDYSILEAELAKQLPKYKNPNSGPTEPEYLFKYKSGNSYYRVTFNEDGSTNLMTPTTGPDYYCLDLEKDVGGVRIDGAGPLLNTKEAILAASKEYIKNKYNLSELTPAVIAKLEENANRLYASKEIIQRLGVRGLNNIDTGTNGAGDNVPFRWSLDLSEFFSKAMPMKIVYWAKFKQ